MFIEGKTISLDNLLFDTRNPRLGAWFDNNDIDDPDQGEILKYFEENKKETELDELMNSIKVDKILHEPLAVQKNSSGEFIVREGNRRLAALYLLKKAGHFNKKFFDEIKVRIFEDNVGEHQIKGYINSQHNTSKKKEWSSYAKARDIKETLENKEYKLQNGKPNQQKLFEVYKMYYEKLVKYADKIKFIQKHDLKESNYSQVDLICNNPFQKYLKNSTLDKKKIEKKLVDGIKDETIKGDDLRVLNKLAEHNQHKLLRRFQEDKEDFHAFKNWEEESGLNNSVINQVLKHSAYFNKSENDQKIKDLIKSSNTGEFIKIKKAIKKLHTKTERYIKLIEKKNS